MPEPWQAPGPLKVLGVRMFSEQNLLVQDEKRWASAP